MQEHGRIDITKVEAEARRLRAEYTKNLIRRLFGRPEKPRTLPVALTA
ncbi:RSP_7527 family protein [Sulfitobacter sp. D35]|nr:hypothetical protein [Sulfitobacter sp. D35]